MDAERHGGQVRPAIEHAGGVRHIEALPLVAQQVLGGDAALVVTDLAEAESVQAHRGLVRGQRESGAVGLHEERGQAGGSLAGAHHHAVQVADVAVADEDLAPVEDVLVPLAPRRRLHAEYMPAGLGLGHRDRGQAVAGRDSGQPFQLLPFVAEVDDLGDAQLRGLHHGAHRAADAREFLDDDRLRQMAHAHAAVALVDGDTRNRKTWCSRAVDRGPAHRARRRSPAGTLRSGGESRVR